jgi:hypothetical protein
VYRGSTRGCRAPYIEQFDVITANESHFIAAVHRAD